MCWATGVRNAGSDTMLIYVEPQDCLSKRALMERGDTPMKAPVLVYPTSVRTRSISGYICWSIPSLHKGSFERQSWGSTYINRQDRTTCDKGYVVGVEHIAVTNRPAIPVTPVIVFRSDQSTGFALIPLSEVLIKSGKLENDITLSSTDLFHSPSGFVHLSLSYTGASADVIAIPPPAPAGATPDSELPDVTSQIFE
ncbi:hypothetical protein LXL04_006693 [Taraxacum kok-saghyz]